MVVINVKVKTLDSRNHDFSVEEDISVKQFKEHIAESVQISADLQRLIYCGRVLNDEKPLKDYDVNGKCLHLVQRPPPSTTGSGSSSNDSSTDSRRSRFHANLPDFDNLVMGSFSIPVPVSVPMGGNIVGPPHTTTSLNPSSTLCGNRITVARHMLQCADNIAAYLENPENGLNNQNMDLLAQQTMESTVLEVGISATTDMDLPQQDVQNIVQAFQGAVSAAFRQNGINNITVHNDPVSMGGGGGPSTTTTSSSITIEFPPNILDSPTTEDQPSTPPSDAQVQSEVPSSVPQTENHEPSAPPNETSSSARTTAATNASSRRQQTTPTQTLAEVVGQMQSVQRRLDPFIQEYFDLLQNDPAFPDDEARENAQRVFDRVSEALHYMSHAQHAISDLMLDMNLPQPRHLFCRPILVEQSAFVSSGLSSMAPVGVGTINIGPIPFGRPPNNNNNNGGNAQANQGQNANPNNPMNNLNENLASSLMSVLGSFGAQNVSSQQQPAGDQPPNSVNNQTNTSTTTTSSTSGGNNAANQQQDNDDAGDDSSDENISARNNQARSNQYRNLLQSLISQATQPNAEVHIINANISVPVPPTTGTSPTPGSNSSTTSTTFTSGNPTETTQAPFNSSTLPTTSTQTRSTSRPILTSTTLPPTSIRNFRPLPANILSSFDRFLPCNSHHISDNSQSQPQQNQQTQTTSIHVRPQRRTVSLDRSQIRQPPTTTIQIPMPINRQLQGSSSSEPPSSNRSRHFSGVHHQDDELNHSFNMFGIEFSLRDLDNLTPNFFNLQRDRLRIYLIETYFGNNKEINDESIAAAISDILSALNNHLERLSGFHHPDYDIRMSIENLIKKSLPFIMNLILEDGSGEFGVRMERQLINFCENVYMILVKCIGVRDTEKYLNDILNIVMTGEVARGNLSKFPAYAVQTFLIERRSYDLSEIQEFLIIKRPAVAEVIVHDEQMEIDEEDSESPMNVEDDRNIQAEDLLNEPLPTINRSEPWHSQFPTSWLPIITRDISRQRRQSPQPPFSDAYISGMSSKRRKVLMSKKSTNAQHMLAEDIRNAVQSTSKPGASSSSQGTSSGSANAVEEVVAAIASDSTIQNAYREEMKTNLSQRIKDDADFESEKYPNSSKYLK